MLTASVTVWAVRAYLSTKTDALENEFTPITYTNTSVRENDKTFTFTGGTATVDIDKAAWVTNNAGGDIKPVFVRMAVTASVYNTAGINVTTDYPVELSFPQAAAAWNEHWTKKGDYYYYNYILRPGESTEHLFDSVTLAQSIPKDYEVKINVMADTVQAVSDDSAGWTAKDYSTTEVDLAWNITPTLTYTPSGGSAISVPNGFTGDNAALGDETDLTIAAAW